MANKKDIKNTVLDIMQCMFGVDSSNTKDSDSFSGDLYIEGRDYIELLLSCEKTFRFKIRAEDKVNITTVKALVNYIKDNA